MEIWCVKGMYMLKVVSSEKKIGFIINHVVITVHQIANLISSH